jgi:hypothetical protein
MEMLQVALSKVSVETGELCPTGEEAAAARFQQVRKNSYRGGMEDVPAVDPPYASRGGKEPEDAEMKEERKKEEGRDGRWRL